MANIVPFDANGNRKQIRKADSMPKNWPNNISAAIYGNA